MVRTSTGGLEALSITSEELEHKRVLQWVLEQVESLSKRLYNNRHLYHGRDCQIIEELINMTDVSFRTTSSQNKRECGRKGS